MQEPFLSFTLFFKSLNETEAPALWLTVEGKDYLINPYALIDSINVFGDVCPLIVSAPWEIHKRVFSIMVVSNDDHRNDRYTWHVEFKDGVSADWVFGDEEYEARLLTRISELGCHILKGGSSLYGFSPVQAGDLMVKLLKCKYYSGWKFLKDIPHFDIEAFSMTLRENEDSFDVSFGKANTMANFEEWENDFASWRRAIERYFEIGETSIQICYEMEPYTISFKKVHFLDHTEDNLGGTFFKYSEKVLLTLAPDEYDDWNKTVGFCDEENIIRQLYTALMELATRRDAICPTEAGHSRRADLFSRKIEEYLTWHNGAGELREWHSVDDLDL